MPRDQVGQEVGAARAVFGNMPRHVLRSRSWRRYLPMGSAERYLYIIKERAPPRRAGLCCAPVGI
jgi:hypothetical protein